MDDIIFQRTSGGERWILPRRDLGKGRWIGLGAVGLGTLILLFMAGWMGGPIAAGINLLREGKLFGWLVIGFGLLGLPGVAAGLGMFGTGIALLTNRMHAEVEIRGDRLVGVERILGLPWKRSRRIADIEQLVIGPALGSSRTPSTGKAKDPMTAAMQMAGAADAIRVTGPRIKELKIAGGYPADMLRELADTLAKRLDVGDAHRAKLMDDTRFDATRVKIVDPPPPPPDGSDDADGQAKRDQALIAAPPSGMKIAVEKNPDGLTMRIPPRGVRKGSAGLFGIGVFWCAFMLVFSIFGIPAILTGEGHSDLPGIWGPVAAIAFIMVFWAVGISMLLIGWHMGRRRAILDVIGDTLLLTRTGPLGTKQNEWRADQLNSISNGPSGISTGKHTPVMALVIEPAVGKNVNLMTGWPDDQLEWAAAVLRQALGVRADSSDVTIDDDDTLSQPSDSKIIIDRRAEGLTLHIPPVGFGRTIVMLIMGFLFAAVGFGVMIGVTWFQFHEKHVKWGVVGFIMLWGIVFGGAGLSVFLSGLAMATRRHTFDVTGGALHIERRGLFGVKHFDWPADQIADICVNDSGTQTNSKQWYQLKITGKNGQKFKCCTGRSIAELRWLAWELRHSVGCTDPS